MKRVAFVFETPLKRWSWLGGVQYFQNLMNSLAESRGEIEIVVFGPQGSTREDFGVRTHDFVSSEVLNPQHRERLLVRSQTGRDQVLIDLLRAHRISLLSHSHHLGTREFPVLSWIADFQHRYYPEFFQASELIQREIEMAGDLKFSRGVLFSSHAAAQDFGKFYPGSQARQFVLPFSVRLPLDEPSAPVASVPERYIYVPNQFWRHKNHRLILRALQSPSARDVSIVCTGTTYDYRDLSYFENFATEVRASGLQNRFLILGVVRREEMLTLMRRACAVLNASLFEGWSTSVEEAKALKKPLLLSRIPVHEEQLETYDRGTLFDREDPEDLARVMAHAVSREVIRESWAELLHENQIACRRYAESYVRILSDPCFSSPT